jgi:hypothetical protein
MFIQCSNSSKLLKNTAQALADARASETGFVKSCGSRITPLLNHADTEPRP